MTARRLLPARDMRVALAIAFALSLTQVAFPTRVAAGDLGTDESRAGICDDYEGLPFVFCVAMCEARECDRLPPGDERCETLAKGFSTVTNGATPPCTVVTRGAI